MRWRPAAEWAEGVWTFALALLIVNDHGLKGSGLLPSVVTGKLSDVAGLVVAPVLVAVFAALAGIRGPRARIVCFAVVVVPFAAIKLSADAARALESFLELAGVRWRVWSDPTDLVALGMLPFAWFVSASLEAHVAERARPGHVLGAILGGIACLATSPHIPPKFQTSAYLVNMARASVTIEVSRVTAALDCTALEASVTSLGASDFEPTFCSTIEPAGIVPLDRDFAAGDYHGGFHGPDEEEPPCDAVLLGARGLAPTIVFWQKNANRLARYPSAESELDPFAVYLEPVERTFCIASSSVMHVRTLEEPIVEVDCSSLEKPKGLP